jgi:hypothetical protein
MNINLLIAIAIIASFVLGYYIRKLLERQEKLENQVNELSLIAQRRKLPYPAQAGLEDAISIVIEVLTQHDAWRAYDETRINQLSDILRQVRSNPQGYDTNQPDQPPKKGK